MVQAHIEQLSFRYPEVSHYAPYDDGVVIKMTTRLCEIQQTSIIRILTLAWRYRVQFCTIDETWCLWVVRQVEISTTFANFDKKSNFSRSRSINMPRMMMAWSSKCPPRLVESSAHRILNVGLGNPSVIEKNPTFYCRVLDADSSFSKSQNFPRFNYFTPKIRFSCNHDHEVSTLHTWGLQSPYIGCQPLKIIWS